MSKELLEKIEEIEEEVGNGFAIEDLDLNTMTVVNREHYNYLIEQAYFIENFKEAFESDDMSNVEKEKKLNELYNNCNNEQRIVIDKTFIHLCGYSFATLIKERGN